MFIFVLKQILGKDTNFQRKFQLGTIVLEKAENPEQDILGMLDMFTQKVNGQKEEMGRLSQKNARMGEDKKKMEERLERYVDVKEFHTIDKIFYCSVTPR